MTTAMLFLIVGLPGAGKTDRAKALAAGHAALRLTPDAWMIPLFGDPQPEGKRDILEGRLIWLALEALRLGTNVALDFGLWSRDERTALRWLARSVGASPQVVYLPVDRATQIERINHRWARTPRETFVMTEADVDLWRSQFEAPDAAELAGETIADPPPGYPDWSAWATERWPTLRADDMH
jgi:predicted kinase